MRDMPALNVEFTDEEMARLRERARSEGVSMKALAHDTVVRCATHADQDALIWSAFDRIKAVSADLLARLADR
jgi:hypothetical protein